MWATTSVQCLDQIWTHPFQPRKHLLSKGIGYLTCNSNMLFAWRKELIRLSTWVSTFVFLFFFYLNLSNGFWLASASVSHSCDRRWAVKVSILTFISTCMNTVQFFLPDCIRADAELFIHLWQRPVLWTTEFYLPELSTEVSLQLLELLMLLFLTTSCDE